MFELMTALILAVGVMFLLAVALRTIASRENPTFSINIPAQTHALVTTQSSKVTDATKGGGNVVDVVHAIPGKKINKSSPNPMDWFYEDGKELRSILYYLIGIQIIGFFRYLRLNDVRTFRWGRKDTELGYHMQAKDLQTRYVFYSGQHDIAVTGVETEGILKINLRFNLIYEEVCPLRVRLKTADPYAVLSMMVSKKVINLVGGQDAKELISDKAKHEELATAIQDISDLVEEQLGVRIMKVTLADVDFDEETKRLLELETKTKLENEAEIAKAEKNKKVQILANDADADRVERVIKAAAENDRTVAVRGMEAYENNKVVHTFAPGANTMIPLGGKQ